MKQFYLVLFFLFISFSYGQEAQSVGGEIEGFKLYPNPATTGKVYIQTAENAPKRILIFNVFGTQILETTILRKYQKTSGGRKIAAGEGKERKERIKNERSSKKDKLNPSPAG